MSAPRAACARFRAWGVALLVAALPPACSNEPRTHPPAAAGVQRLALAPLDERPGEPVVVVRTWDASDPQVDWEPRPAAGGSFAYHEKGSDAVLELLGEGPRRLILPGPFGAGEDDRIDHLEIHGRPGGRDTLQVLALSSAGDTWLGPQVGFSTEEPGSPFTYDLLGLRDRPRVVERLVLLFGGRTPSTRIARVELSRFPRARHLPDPSGAPRFLELGDHSRRGVGLAPGRDLGCRFEVPPRARLELAFGQSPMLRSGQESPVVLLRVEAPSREAIERRIPLAAAPLEGRWSEAQVDLGPLAGATARLSLSLIEARASVAAVAEPLLVAAEPARPAPTLVLITSDTHRGDHLGAARSGVEVRTPFVDRLAEQGTLFEDAWAPCNITRPSHSTLLTGTLVDAHGVTTNRMPLARDARTLAEVLAERGWLCFAAVSTLLLGEPQSGTGQGFDRLGAPRTPHRRSNATVELLRSWLPAGEGVPLFVWLHLYDAHGPYEVPTAWQRMYYPPERDPAAASLPELDGGRRPRWETDARDPQWFRAQYGAEISFLDAQLAELFREPRLERATVAFTADHGEALDEGELWWRHTQLYPNTLHVPLVLRGEGATPGARVAQPVMIRDLPRTLLDMVGLREAAFPGRNLLALLDAPAGSATQPGPPAAEPRFAVGSGALHASVQLGRWYLFLHIARDDQLADPPPEHSVELYDLERDPRCRDDVSPSELETAKRLRALLVAWLSGFRTPSETPDDGGALDVEVLAELGYQGAASARSAAVDFDPDCRCERCRRFE